MSLKAKLEAVIYAAEEPVTLAQLAGLFADEALEWKAEQEAAATAAKAAELPGSAQIDEGLEYLGLEETPELYAVAESAAATIAEEGEAAPAAEEREGAGEAEAPRDAELAGGAPTAPSDFELTGAPVRTEAEPAAVEAAAVPATDPESEAKRAARVRDREVRAVLRQILDEIVASYAGDERGIEIREIAGGYRMATKPECHDAVRQLIKSLKPPMKLSLPALETLAVIAYKQPVTAPEVNEIRGVESGGVLGSLLSRKLITTAGRKQVIGRPILYKTTKEFLLRFGLKDVSELPSMEEFEKMAAIELEDEATEADAGAGSGPELDENAPEEGAEDSAQSIEAEKDTEMESPVVGNGAQAEPDASNEHAVVETAPHD